MSRRKVTKTCWVKGGGKRIGGVEKKSRRERTRNVITGAASNTRHEVVIREFSHSQQTWCHILDILVNSLCCNVLPRFFSFKNPSCCLWNTSNANFRRQSVSEICKVSLYVIVYFTICLGERESTIKNLRQHGLSETCGKIGVSTLNCPNTSGGA